MAAARQKEMNDSMTVVATTTLTASGRLLKCHGNTPSITHFRVTLKFACEVS